MYFRLVKYLNTIQTVKNGRFIATRRNTISLVREKNFPRVPAKVIWYKPKKFLLPDLINIYIFYIWNYL